ncbi:MAG: YdcF family protein [Burkholderiales bacterium]|nr:YdcF family protein [Burkholderiales bacterium]
MLADWMTAAGFGALKPAISALLLPPVPFLLLAFAGAALARRRPRASRWLVVAGIAGAWLGCCSGAARWVEERWLDEPSPLNAAERATLKARAAAGQTLAIVVLGGGLDARASEYPAADLRNASLKRLRYGLWLGRETGIPVAASGGRGWATSDVAVPAEATRMAEVARGEFGLPLRWVEAASRDTHENATGTLALLQPAGVREVLLVTHGSHMPRALREFRAAAAAQSASSPIAITPAPMGQAWPADSIVTRWTPSGAGLERMQLAMHEVLGRMIDRR